ALIEGDRRPVGVRRLGVEIEHVLHVPDVVGTYPRDAPLLTEPGLRLVFLSVRRTVSSEIVSTTLSSTSLSASICMLQCSRPSGGSLQASATRKASPLPSSFGSDPGRGRSY